MSNLLKMLLAGGRASSDPGTVEKDIFNMLVWYGDGAASHALTGMGFQADLDWVKQVNDNRSHRLVDIARGVQLSLFSDLTNNESNETTGLLSFDADGLTVGSSAGFNINNGRYECWGFKAGGATVANNDGSIASQVSVGEALSIVIWNHSTAADYTVGHGGASAPKLVLTKSRDLSVNWSCWHEALTGTNRILLNSDGGQIAGYWPTTPMADDSVLNIGSIEWATNNAKSLAYCFFDVEGFCKVFSYEGTADEDGPEVDCGFAADFLIVVGIDNTGRPWRIHDIRRGGFQDYVSANVSSAEVDDSGIFARSKNGFKVTGGAAYGAYNTNGETYVGVAFKQSSHASELHQVETGNLQISDALTDDNGTHTITNNGVDVVEEKGIKFDGSGDYLTIPYSADFDFGAGGFTIDMWFQQNGGSSVMLTSRDTGAEYCPFILDVGVYGTANKAHAWVSNGSTWTISLNSTTDVNDGDFHHIALVSNGSTISLYVDGVSEASTSIAFSPVVSGDPLKIGSDFGGASVVNGYLKHPRITKGEALWTSDFTPPDRNTVPTPGANTVLLLDDDILGSKWFADLSDSAHSIALNGDVVHDAPTCGDKAFEFNGTSDTFESPDSDDWDLVATGTTQYTVDFWVKHDDHAGEEMYITQSNDNNTANFWGIEHNDGSGLRFFVQVAGSNVIDKIFGGEITDTDWHHIALTRNGSVYSMYKDGILLGTYTDTSTTSFSGPLIVGCRSDNGGRDKYFDGQMDMIRVTKGTALWTTTNFNLTDKGLKYEPGTLNI
ncbi:MAG: LamG domain-containing protein [Spirochaetaceae bacterium]